jgi:hypothetical protein
LGAPVVPPVWKRAVGASGSRVGLNELVAALAGAGAVEVQHLQMGRQAWYVTLDAADHQHLLHAGRVGQGRAGALPQRRVAGRAFGHQHPAAAGRQDAGDGAGAHRRTDRAGDRHRLGTEQRHIGLRQIGQQHGHAVVAGQALRMQPVGQAPAVRQQLRVRPGQRRLVGVAVGQEAQRRTLGMAGARGFEHLPYALGGQHRVQRGRAFQGFDVGQSGHARQCLGHAVGCRRRLP